MCPIRRVPLGLEWTNRAGQEKEMPSEEAERPSWLQEGSQVWDFEEKAER